MSDIYYNILFLSFLCFVASLGAVIIGPAFQIKKILATKKVENVSMATFICFMIAAIAFTIMEGSAGLLRYSYDLILPVEELVLVAIGILCIFENILIVYLISKYRSNSKT